MCKLAIILVAATALAGCASQAVTLPPAPKSPDQALYEGNAAFDVVLKQANVYASLPRCGTATATAVCSTQVIVNKLGNDASVANAAITQARAAVTAYDALTAPGASDLTLVNSAISLLAAAVTDITADMPASK